MKDRQMERTMGWDNTILALRPDARSECAKTKDDDDDDAELDSPGF